MELETEVQSNSAAIKWLEKELIQIREMLEMLNLRLENIENKKILDKSKHEVGSKRGNTLEKGTKSRKKDAKKG